MRTPEQNPPSGSSFYRYIRSLSYQPAEGMDSPLSLGGLLVSLSLDPACRTCSKRVPIDSLRPKQFAAQPDLPAWVYARAIFPADFAGECSPPPPWPWPRKAPWQLLCRCLLLPLPSLAIPQRKMCATPSKSRKSNRHHSRGTYSGARCADRRAPTTYPPLTLLDIFTDDSSGCKAPQSSQPVRSSVEGSEGFHAPRRLDAVSKLPSSPCLRLSKTTGWLPCPSSLLMFLGRTNLCRVKVCASFPPPHFAACSGVNC